MVLIINQYQPLIFQKCVLQTVHDKSPRIFIHRHYRTLIKGRPDFTFTFGQISQNLQQKHVPRCWVISFLTGWVVRLRLGSVREDKKTKNGTKLRRLAPVCMVCGRGGARLGELVTRNCQGMTDHCSYSYPPICLFSNVENTIKSLFGAFVSSQATREFHTHIYLSIETWVNEESRLKLIVMWVVE